MKPLAALAISATMLFAQSDRVSLHSVTAIRNWSLAEVTRIAVEVSGDFHFRSDRLHNPERVYFDILGARPRIDDKRFWSKAIDDKLVQRVRVAETSPGTTRIVLDLAGPAEVTASQLSNPNRLIIEMRAARGPAVPTHPTPPAAKPPQAPTAGKPIWGPPPANPRRAAPAKTKPPPAEPKPAPAAPLPAHPSDAASHEDPF